ncbi:uncharacterized protein LOC120458473 isoform X1 [Drosophila santomea]|uniref:uncharacterized protein LOC120458473 isoform X1 n=1 Tax=Drosophila santomea TaxID=129105 RepID=UPI00195423A8|nr:uncharacterized protein LOC120458473 isoform X1 [Drosophila santomea]
MTSLECVFVAGLLHVMQFLALYSKCSNIPNIPQIPSLIVGLAAMDLIWDNCFVPRALYVMPSLIRRIYEVAVAYMLLKIAVQGFWKTVEEFCVILMSVIVLGTGLVSKTTYRNYESYWVGSLTVPLSLLILAFAGHATDHFHVFHNGIFHVQQRVELRWKETLRYITRNPGRKLARIVPILEMHKDLARGQRRRRTTFVG